MLHACICICHTNATTAVLTNVSEKNPEFWPSCYYLIISFLESFNQINMISDSYVDYIVNIV